MTPEEGGVGPVVSVSVMTFPFRLKSLPVNTANVCRVPGSVNPRRYSAPRRVAQAERTRARIVDAARELFLNDGYERTPVATIAERAGVSVETLYTSVGRKPEVMRAVIDAVLGEGRGPVPAEERGYVEQVRATSGARAKLTAYADALGRLQPAIAPLTQALREAGLRDEACRAAWVELVERRARNMRVLAAELRAGGELRADLDDATVADLIWATNSADHYLLLASRGWSPERYAAHLADLWTRLFLADP